MNKKKLIKWIILFFWLLVIFMFSHEQNSGSATKEIISTTISVKEEPKTEPLLDGINFIVRKSAHITEFIILTLILFSLTSEYTKNEKKIIIISIITCILCASGDELHQYFVPGRTALVTDVLIDSIGAIIALIIYKLIPKRSLANVPKK